MAANPQFAREIKTVSILVADDHEMVRQGLCTLLEMHPDWKTLEATNGHEAAWKAAQLHPDVVVMDINMPHLNGLDAARQIRKMVPKMPVIMLSGYSNQDLIDKALAAGVHGYLVKTDAAKNLVAAVASVLRGQTFFTGIVSNRLLEHLRGARPPDTTSQLTVREVQVIQLLCEGKANKEVANELGLSTRTVENHRAQIMKKLGLTSFSEMIRYAIRNAIVQP